MSVFFKDVEKKLIEEGFDQFTLHEKNALIAILAERDNKMYSEITNEYILNYHKKIKGDMLSELCDESIVNGFVSTNGHTYRTNRDDQSNMIGKMVHLMYDSTITHVQWKTEDASYINHTRQEWIDKVFIEGLSHKEATLYKYNTKKYQVATALTDAAVVAVGWV